MAAVPVIFTDLQGTGIDNMMLFTIDFLCFDKRSITNEEAVLIRMAIVSSTMKK